MKINWFTLERKCGKLGEVQKKVLAQLSTHRSWFPGCGWTWTNRSETKRIMDSLVKRGAAIEHSGIYRVKPDYLEVN